MEPKTKNSDINYDVLREGEDVTLVIDFEKSNLFASIEDNPRVMAITMEKILEAGKITKIVFRQKRDYEYDFAQTQILAEIADLYNKFVKQKAVSAYLRSDANVARYTESWYTDIQNLIFNSLTSDPISTYVMLKRRLRVERISLDKVTDQTQAAASQKYIALLNYLVTALEKTKLIQVCEPYLQGYKVGDRTIYRKIFAPTIKPDFMYAKLMASYPPVADEIDAYTVGDAEVTIFSVPENIRYLYHVVPPEFKLSEENYELLDEAKKVMAEHKPKRSEFVDPQRMREVFYNVGHDLMEELSNYKNMRLRSKELDEMTRILVRYTVGFGLIEVLLADDKVQDITINAPMGQVPIFIVHQDYTDCSTNIIPTTPEAESWASKLRMISGRPLDEANPVLDTDLSIPGASTRVAAVMQPLNPYGIAFAFRRHRDKPWTLPLFIHSKMINPLAAGIMSFIIDGSRTILVAGTRSAGKTSLLGSLLTEIMRKYRIITIEDTLELPTAALRREGYNIQPLQVASALSRGTTEVTADEGIRTTLRMGDSCLIVGEVRSTEARALYEAMRVGALANVVAGTIHGDSPFGVFDRVVNDLNVPKTSFKATDIIMVANPIKSADGLHRWRRVTQITEVRKFWEDDPLLENGFVDLMKYDAKKDELVPSTDLMNGDSDILKSIASNVKDWAGNWDAVWDNIMLRAKIKETIVKVADSSSNLELLEAPFVIRCNDEFHRIADRIKEESGTIDCDRIFTDWSTWLKREVKKAKG